MAAGHSSIKKNDNVLVIAGRDRGKRGRVLSVTPNVKSGTTAVIVEGVNMIKRHTKANPQKNVKGGIVERETGMNVAKVQIVCSSCGAATRIGHQLLEDGRKVRVCRKCKGVLDK
jgi:large subunit ribosomal protein L24